MVEAPVNVPRLNDAVICSATPHAGVTNVITLLDDFVAGNVSGLSIEPVRGVWRKAGKHDAVLHGPAQSLVPAPPPSTRSRRADNSGGRLIRGPTEHRGTTRQSSHCR